MRVPYLIAATVGHRSAFGHPDREDWAVITREDRR
jgi:hypothetical protein